MCRASRSKRVLNVVFHARREVLDVHADGLMNHLASCFLFGVEAFGMRDCKPLAMVASRSLHLYTPHAYLRVKMLEVCLRREL